MARRSGLEGMSVGELEKEIKRRQRRAGPLQKRRDKLQAKLDALDAQIAELGGASGGRGGASGRKRPRNEMSLVEMIIKVLDGKTMGVSELAEAVQKAGYKTSSSSFRTIVNQTLINNKNKFKCVERGQYAVKG